MLQRAQGTWSSDPVSRHRQENPLPHFTLGTFYNCSLMLALCVPSTYRTYHLNIMIGIEIINSLNFSVAWEGDHSKELYPLPPCTCEGPRPVFFRLKKSRKRIRCIASIRIKHKILKIKLNFLQKTQNYQFFKNVIIKIPKMNFHFFGASRWFPQNNWDFSESGLKTLILTDASRLIRLLLSLAGLLEP